MRYIIAIDPGLKTGMCLFQWDGENEPILMWSVELDMHEVAPYVRGALTEHPELEFAVERFTINAQTAKKTQAPYSLELIGVIKQCLRDVGRDPDTDITLQQPADAMNMFPNPALKKLEYWHVGGAGHALDSIRHGLLYMVRKKWAPKRLLD